MATKHFYFVFGTYEEAAGYLPSFTSPQRATLEAESERAAQASRDSWERSDTDGCVSQWCSDITAAEKMREATLRDRGSLVVVPALMDAATGEIVCPFVTTRPSPFASWQTENVWIFRRSPNAPREYVRDYKREAKFSEKGLRKVWLLAPGEMRAREPGDQREEKRGLSGLASYSGKYAGINVAAAGFGR